MRTPPQAEQRDPEPEDLEDIVWTCYAHPGRSDRAEAEAAFWAPIWRTRGGPTWDNTREARLECAWRLLRRMSTMRGALRHDERLTQLGRIVDPFDAEFIHTEDVTEQIPLGIYDYLAAGLPLLPPDVPQRFLLDAPEDGGGMLPAPSGRDAEYDPRIHDEPLRRYVELLRVLGKQIGLHESARTAPGFVWLTDITMLRHAWPQLSELVQFEQRLISSVKRQVLATTTIELTEKLETEHGLSEDEAIGIMAIVLSSLQAASHLDNRQGSKAKVLAKLERLGKMAEDAFDHRGSAIIQREWWRVFRDEGTVDAEDFEAMSLVIQRSALKAGAAESKPPTEDDEEGY